MVPNNRSIWTEERWSKITRMLLRGVVILGLVVITALFFASIAFTPTLGILAPLAILGKTVTGWMVALGLAATPLAAYSGAFLGLIYSSIVCGVSLFGLKILGDRAAKSKFDHDKNYLLLTQDETQKKLEKEEKNGFKKIQREDAAKRRADNTTQEFKKADRELRQASNPREKEKAVENYSRLFDILKQQVGYDAAEKIQSDLTVTSKEVTNPPSHKPQHSGTQGPNTMENT